MSFLVRLQNFFMKHDPDRLYLAKRIADMEYHNLPPIKVKTSRIKTKENYIPNLNLEKNLA